MDSPSTEAWTAWDENISIAWQDQELEMMDANNVPGPAPSALPLPSWTWPEPTAETGENVGDEDSKKLEKKPTSLSGDWWEAVRDKRLLRGRRDRSSSSSSTDPPEQGGITQRFGRTRAGVDRWHHPDGTVRNRLRERLAAAQQEVEEETMESTPDTTDNALPPNHAPFAVEGWTQLDDGPAVTAVTFYGEKFHVWASGNNIAGDLGAEESTTAGDDCNGTVADTENGTSSSSESTQSVGFYRHGEWQPRERTPLEQRLHTGGRGLQRTRRRQERMDNYLWRPAWLENYIGENEICAEQVDPR